MIQQRLSRISALLLLCFIYILPSCAYKVELLGAIDRASEYALKDMANAYQIVDRDVVLASTNSDTTLIERMLALEYDFGMTTRGMSSNWAAAAPSISLFPLVLTSIVPCYRLDSLDKYSSRLAIPRVALARIYMGEIHYWDHPDLVKANPMLTLPHSLINIVLEEDVHNKYVIMKQAFSHFYEPFAQSNFSAPTNENNWPYHRYAKYTVAPATPSGLVTKSLNSDGTLAVTWYGIASTFELSIADMVNKMGHVVSATTSSMTLAAVDGGANDLERNEVADLIDSSNEKSWPMTVFSYLMISTSESRSTCRTREALVRFFLYFYQNPMTSVILGYRGFAVVPAVIIEQLGIVEYFTKSITCRGSVALPPSLTSIRSVGVSQNGLFQARLMSSAYMDANASVSFVPQMAHDELIVQQLIMSELDLGLVNPSNVDATKWAEIVDSDEFLILPAWGIALTWVINPQLTNSISLSSSTSAAITSQPLILDIDMLAQLTGGCIMDYQSALILSKNPWIASMIGNHSIPITQFWGCDAKSDVSTSVVKWIVSETAKHGSPESQQCLDADRNPMWQSVLATAPTCIPTGYSYYYVPSEHMIPALTLGTPGAISTCVSDGDPAKLYPTIPMTRNAKTNNTSPTINSILACASDTYDPARLTFDFASSLHPDCWSLSQMVNFVVRKQYYSHGSVTNSSSCSRGIDSLKYVRHLITTDEIHTLTDSANNARLFTANPRILQDYINALNQVLCDDEPLLIILPVEWKLNQVLQGFGYAVASIGMFITSLYMIFVMRYHRHPVIRSASPLFILISLVGVMVMFSSIIPLVQTASFSSCSSLAWTFDIGVAMTFGPLFVKNYRIYRIFGGRKLQVVKMSNQKLMGIVVAFFAIELAILSAWEAVSPLQPVTTVIMEGSPARAHNYLQCSTLDSAGDAFFVVIAIEKGLLLLGGALLSFSVRKVTSQFNESKQIALTIYCAIFTISLIGVLIGVIGVNGDVKTVLLLIIAGWISLFTGSMLVIPTALHILYGKEDPNANTGVIAGTGHSSNGFSFVSLDFFTSLPMIGSYLTALQQHMEAVQRKQTALRSGEKRLLTVQQPSTPSGSRGNSTPSESRGPSTPVSNQVHPKPNIPAVPMIGRITPAELSHHSRMFSPTASSMHRNTLMLQQQQENIESGPPSEDSTARRSTMTETTSKKGIMLQLSSRTNTETNLVQRTNATGRMSNPPLDRHMN